MEFNDPFDCIIPLTPVFKNSDLLPKYEEMLTVENPKLPKTMIRNKAKEIIKQGMYKDSEAHKAFHLDQIKGKYGVCSLTEDYQNLLMWAHYANCHKGICVGIDCDKVVNTIYESQDGTKKVLYLQKVRYYDEWPELKYRLVPEAKDLRTKDEILFESTQQLLAKSKHWEYEQEWRILSLDVNQISVQIEPDAIHSVYLGARLTETHKNEIVELCRDKYPQAQLFETKIMEDRYGLDFRKI